MSFIQRAYASVFAIPALGAVALLAFFFQGRALNIVNAAYERSGHPVGYGEGQTSFNAGAVKGWYGDMIAGGTLDLYVQTQIIDYLFIFALAVFGLAMLVFSLRALRRFPRVRRLAVLASSAIIFGAFCDAVEDLISFVMLADPQGFADWIVLPYSGFAVLKFAAIIVGYLGLIATALWFALAMGARLLARRT